MSNSADRPLEAVLDPDHHRDAFAAGAFLRVVNWHNTPAGKRAELRAELAAYAGRYQPVTPDDLDRWFDTGEWRLTKPGFIPVFYDGYRNHATVAGPVCDELGLTAWFLPPTALLDVPPDEQRAYAEAHDVDLVLDEEPDPPWTMTWDELAGLARRHVVAAHTANHAAARQVVTAEDAEREVHEPVRRLAELTGRTPPAFAFLLGTVPQPGTIAGDAVLSSGVRYAITNTAYLRIAD